MRSPQNVGELLHWRGHFNGWRGATRAFNFGGDDGRFNGWRGGARAFGFGGSDLVGVIVAREIYYIRGTCIVKNLAVGFKEPRRVEKQVGIQVGGGDVGATIVAVPETESFSAETKVASDIFSMKRCLQ